MRPSQTSLLTLIVSLALAGGLVAFLLATPDEGRRPSGDALGFSRLNEQQVLGDLQHAEEYHRARHREALVVRAASRNAAAWLRTVAGSGDEARAMPKSVAVDRAALPFVRWADDIPRAAWKASITKVERADVTDVEGGTTAQFVATGFVEVTVASAANRTRRQRVPVELTMTPQGGDSDTVPVRWLLSVVKATDTPHFLRAYADPIVARRGASVDVIAPVAERALANRLADDAAKQLPALTVRYRAVAGPGVVSVWVLESSARSRAVLNRTAPVTTTTAAPAELHGAAWVDASGDIAVDASRMRKLTPDEQVRALRHAIAHVATRHVADSDPALLEEGIAQYEALRIANPSAPIDGVDFGPLVDAFGGATSGLSQLLVAKPAQQLDTGDASTDELAALATVAWIEDAKGHEALVRLVTLLDRGSTPSQALGSVLKLDARGVEVAVARWTRARADEGSEETPADGDAGSATDQEQHQ